MFIIYYICCDDLWSVVMTHWKLRWWLAFLAVMYFLIKVVTFYFLFIFLTFIHFWETERDRAWVGKGQREGDTESKAGPRLRAVSTEPDAGLQLTNCEITTWAEVGCSTDWATQAPPDTDILKMILISHRELHDLDSKRPPGHFQHLNSRIVKRSSISLVIYPT